MVPGEEGILGSTVSEIGPRGPLLPSPPMAQGPCVRSGLDKAQSGKRLVPFPDKTTRGQWSTLADSLQPRDQEPGRSAEASDTGETGMATRRSETILRAH